MNFAINSPPHAEPGALVELAVAAERAGWDAFFLWDHMVIDRAGIEIVDPWVALGAIAARTERIRLGTCVTPVARRRPQKLARETVTLDRLSDGRLIFGIGLGHPPEEFTTFGEAADLPAVAARADEAMEVIAGLWSGEPYSHAGPHFGVEEVRFLPAPRQRPRPPVWVACMLPFRRGLARAARWDGVVPLQLGAGDDLEFLTPDDIAGIAHDIRDRRGSLDGFDIVVNPGPPPHGTVDEFAAAGATWWMDSMGDFPGWYDELRGVVEAGPPR